MQTPNSQWDVERAAAWLRRHAWGGEESAPAPGALLALAAAQAAAPLTQMEQEEIDIAGWPALVAPFYD